MVLLLEKSKLIHNNYTQTTLPGRVQVNMEKKYLQKEAQRCICCTGAFTLEAAVILPLLACFFVSILFFFRVMQVQLEVQKALDDTGRKLAVFLPVNEKSLADDVAGRVAAEVLLRKELDGREEAKRYITGGVAGVSLVGSRFEGENVYLQATYRVGLPVNLIAVPAIKVVLKAECRKWTGRRPDGEAEGTVVWVYITEQGTVYHRTKSCSHLTLSIRAVEQEEVAELRNEGGERYSPCHLCKESENDRGRVYITNLGNRYHTDLNCGGIKRTIRMVRLSEVGDRPACSKCSVQEQALILKQF